MGTLFVAEHYASYVQSMKLLEKNGLRPLTYNEALLCAPELIKNLKGKWFWLAGERITEDGLYTFNAHGELAEYNGKIKKDKKVRVFPGDQPLSFSVASIYHAKKFGRWFDIIAYGELYKTAPVVVGVTGMQKTIDAGRAALARLKRDLSE